MVALFWILFSVAVGVLAANRGRSGFGFFLLSLVISPLLGLIFALAVKNLAAEAAAKKDQPSGATHVRCGACAEWVLPEAAVCKHCGAKLEPDVDFYVRRESMRRQAEQQDNKNLAIGFFFIAALIGLVALVSR